MIVDCHAHLEPRMLAPDAMLAKLDAAGVARVALIPAMNDPLPHTPEKLLRTLRHALRRRVTRGIAELVHRALLTPEGDLRLDGRVVTLYARPDNASVAELVTRHPDRFWGWIFLNPRNNPTVLDELERWRSVPGMIGVKLHPHWHDYRTSLLHPLLARCEELALPVLIHLGFRERGAYRDLAERFPQLTIIAAHAGFPFFDELWHYRGAHHNLHVDLSSPYVDEALVRECVAALGPERCLYGTDAPYGFHQADGSYDYGEIRRWVERLPVTSQGQERIFAGNFLRVVTAARSAT